MDSINDRQIREHDLRLAQQSPRALIDNTVVQRLRPDYDAAGIDWGSFRIFPSLGVQFSYDTNIFQTKDAEADEEALIQPSLSVRSNWERHVLGLNASATIERFARHETENLENYDLSTNGVLDFGVGGHLSGLARVAKNNESRGTIGDLFPGGEPIQYGLQQLNGGVEEHWAGAFAKVNGDFVRYRYDDVRYQGVTYSQDYRNRDEARVSGELALNIGAGVALFTELTANKVHYVDQPRASNFSSKGESLIGGFTFQVPSILSGEIGIGYLRQKYDFLPFRPVKGLSYDLALIWNITPLLTATATGHRGIQQTPFVEAPSIVESNFSAQFDYELLPNVLFKLRATVTLDDFGRAYRIDKRLEQTLTVQYLISRALRANASIEHRNQNARSQFLRPYEGIAFRIGLTVQR